MKPLSKVFTKELTHFIVILLALPALISCSGSGGGNSAGVKNCDIAVEENLDVTSQSAKYCATFIGNWNSNDFGAVPGSAHFTDIAGAAVNSESQIWALDVLASNGLELLAEKGQTLEYRAELMDAEAQDIFVVGETDATGSTSFIFELKRDYPSLNFATMLAPSPDWFVGFSEYSLINESSEWVLDSGDIDLPVYDAGTETANTFTLQGENTVPAELVSLLTENVDGSIDFIDGQVDGKYIATIRLKRIQ